MLKNVSVTGNTADMCQLKIKKKYILPNNFD